MIRMLARFCIGIGILCGPAVALPYSYVVTVKNSSDPGSGIKGRCAPRVDGECEVSLGELDSVIGRSGWKQSLHELGVNKVVVSFSEEIYRLKVPLKIRWSSDVKGVALELVGKNTRFLGSTSLVFRRLASDGATFPKSVLPRLWIAEVPIKFDGQPPTGFGMPLSPTSGELVYENVVQPVARWPNTGFASIELAPKDRKGAFRVVGRDVSDWKNESAMRAFAFWFYDWSSQTYPVKYSEGLNALEVVAGDVKYGVKGGQRVRILNAIRELDVEGEWYLEERASRIYWWAPSSFNGGGGEYVVAESLMNVEDSSDVKISGLSFEASRGDAVSISRSMNVVLDGVIIRNAGGRSLVIEDGEKCGIKNSHILDSGEGGIVLSGGDRVTLKAAGHFVDSSEIKNFSRFGATYRPAVMMSGVGMRVVKNSMHEAGHAAIIFSGNDHLVSENEIYQVVMDSSDAGAVYVGRDLTARGSKVEGNYFHDIGSAGYSRDVKGVYLDDQASGIEVKDNIFFKVRQPVFIGGGRDNLVVGNFFIDSEPAIFVDARGGNSQRLQTIDPNGELMKRLLSVPYKSRIWASKYPNLPGILDDDFGLPKYNVFCGNVVLNGVVSRISNEASTGVGISGNVHGGEDILLVGSIEKAVAMKNFSIKSQFRSQLSCH